MPSKSAKQAALMQQQADPGLPAEKRRVKIEQAQQMHSEDRQAGRFFSKDGTPTPEMREHLASQGGG